MSFIKFLLHFLPDVFMVFGGALPYLPQYQQIRETRTTGSFSKHVCLVLLIANSLRIFFRVGEVYETALFLQAVVMIFAMFALVELVPCLKPEEFWNWTYFVDYLQFMVLFWIVVAFTTYVFLHSPSYFNILGFLALGTESLLATPQLWKNYQNSSTTGMSMFMVLGWLVGDIFKTGYFVFLNQPFQFILCGSIQVTVDCLIICQVFYYKSSKKVSTDPEDLTAVLLEDTEI
ncbi:Oidioi.mRNA.OKI2018_I69.chr1.g3467.t1.cds [Oikopleura dioica]|uniref:Oidioi.mRNA.OKI2018_I69.chr1.g3467.t1.cds n=1 Tax=Oikopleura dioica TaxID=34765 RepID=A0ABN7SXR6_OIKDI|nr:Oidioi.mRNA.OKI2018_I69.chr1.g3467.t1.cds [Oikopleura dioica]